MPCRDDERAVGMVLLGNLMAPQLDAIQVETDPSAAETATALAASLAASPQTLPATATAHDYYTEQPLGPASEELDALAFGKGGAYEILASCVDGVWVPVQGQAEQWRRCGATVRRVYVTNGASR